MSRFAWVVLLIVLGIAFYHHFYGDADEEDNTAEIAREAERAVIADVNAPPVPESCQGEANAAENALYGAANHRVSFAQRNRALRQFQACLRNEGFSDDQVEAATAAKKEKVRRYLKMDQGG
jgi:hypothetical protein